jgi:predicted transcriptional regulator of viral defense system
MTRHILGVILGAWADVVDIGPDIGAQCRPRDLVVAAIAGRQHGVVARSQLLAMGLGRGAISHRLAAGRLHRIHGGVYAVGHSVLTGRGRWTAAVLACGSDALLSHRSAAALWGIGFGASPRIDVTVARRSRRGRPGIAVHQVRGLTPDERDRRDGIPVTSVARTMLDIAEVLPARQLERAFEEADRLQLLDLRAISQLCERGCGHHGLRALRALLSKQLRPVPESAPSSSARFWISAGTPACRGLRST